MSTPNRVENTPVTEGASPTLPRSFDVARVGVVVAAYNESAVLAEVLDGLRKRFPFSVVVDDGSTDDTFEVARRHSQYALRHPINRGQGAALQTGIEFALDRGAEVVVTFDADGQHQVQDIEKMIAPIVNGECDICLGSRFLGKTRNLPLLRRLVLKAGVLFTRVVSRIRLTDTHNGFRAFSRKGATCIDLTIDRMAHASEMIDQIRGSGLPFREIPVEIIYTEHSMQKGQSSRAAFRIVLDYLMGRVLR